MRKMILGGILAVALISLAAPVLAQDLYAELTRCCHEGNALCCVGRDFMNALF